MTELNAYKNMSLGSIFRCMCNYGFCFEAYVSMTVFGLPSTSRYLAVCITWSKLMILSWRQWRSQGERETPAPGAAFWGCKLRFECHVAITKCRMSTDAGNYDLQNVKFQSLIPSCKISAKSPRFAKGVITNLSDVLKASLVSPETSAFMWFDWRLRHNAFR